MTFTDHNLNFLETNLGNTISVKHQQFIQGFAKTNYLQIGNFTNTFKSY